MAYTAHRDTRYGYYGGNSLPYSQATPQPYSPENDQTNAPPSHWVPTAGLPVHSSGYATQWNAPTLHSSVQDQRYGWPVPYVNGVAGSYSVWTDAQQSASFAPVRAMNAVTPYQNQSHYRDTDNAPNGPMAYHEDNRTPASRDRNGWVTAGVRSRGVVDYGPTLARASTNSAAGNDVQVSAPDDEVPMSSESLKTLSKRYVLDPGTSIETVQIESGRCGRLKIIITLEAADGI